MDVSLYALLTWGVGIAFSFGAASAYFRGGRNKGTIELLLTEKKAYEDKALRLEQENAALSGKVEVLEKANHQLTEVAQQTPEVRKLTSEIANLAGYVASIAKELGVQVEDAKKKRRNNK